MGVYSAGYEGIAKIGAAGSTASTVWKKNTDITYNAEHEEDETSTREDSDVPPIVYFMTVARAYTLSISAPRHKTDASTELLVAAAMNGTPLALRTLDHATGKGFDGDVNVKVNKGLPLKGKQTLEFSFTPNNQLRQCNPYI